MKERFDSNGRFIVPLNSLKKEVKTEDKKETKKMKEKFKLNGRHTIIDSFNFKSQNNKMIKLYKMIANQNA